MKPRARSRWTRVSGIRSTLDAALTMAEAWRREREPDLAQSTPGFYLDFEIHPGSEMAADLLENRRKNIELVAVRQESETANIVATVFVPDASPRSFPEKGRGISGRKYEAIRLHSLSLASTHVRVCVRRH